MSVIADHGQHPHVQLRPRVWRQQWLATCRPVQHMRAPACGRPVSRLQRDRPRLRYGRLTQDPRLCTSCHPHLSRLAHCSRRVTVLDVQTVTLWSLAKCTRGTGVATVFSARTFITSPDISPQPLYKVTQLNPNLEPSPLLQARRGPAKPTRWAPPSFPAGRTTASFRTSWLPSSTAYARRVLVGAPAHNGSLGAIDGASTQVHHNVQPVGTSIICSNYMRGVLAAGMLHARM